MTCVYQEFLTTKIFDGIHVNLSLTKYFDPKRTFI